MITPNVGEPRGILNPEIGRKKFHLSLHAPTQDLALFIEHYWIIDWDLRGQEPYLSETLPHPCIHLVIEQNQSRIVGVVRGRFSYLLTGKGSVFGVKFRPGAFYPLAKAPVSMFTDEIIRFQDAFGMESAPLEEALHSRKNNETMIALMEDFLRARHLEPDDNIGVIRQIVDRIMVDRSITKVDDVVQRLAINKRALQRLFSQYVGVSPKWVIKRYRLHEAAERLAAGEVVAWPQLALDLGYFDQAHFINDFKAIVGKAPAEYARNLGLDCF